MSEQAKKTMVQADAARSEAKAQEQSGIDFHYWPTPNGQKVAIFLEEAAVAYRVHPVDLGRRDQYSPEFQKISPNNRMPAIEDRDAGVSVFESGAILLHLAEKTGRFMPKDPQARVEVLQWLFWQMGGLGPMMGQAAYFLVYAPEPIPAAIERYSREVARLFEVLDRRLSDRPYVAGDYSIADMAAYPWIGLHEKVGIDLADYPNVARWFDAIRERPAVQRAYAKGEEIRPSMLTDAQRKALFAQKG